MTSKKSSRKPLAEQPAASSPAGGPAEATPAAMVRASESAWSGVRVLGHSKSSGLSRNRMVEARGELLRSEKDYIALSTEAREMFNDEAEALQRKAARVQAEAWAIEQEAQTRVTVLRAQARMESLLAKHIRTIAERSALSVLDRIKEASDSLMDWADLIGTDLSDMLKQEASEQVDRKVAEIQALEEATDEEVRAAELLELTARYQNDLAA